MATEEAGPVSSFFTTLVRFSRVLSHSRSVSLPHRSASSVVTLRAVVEVLIVEVEVFILPFTFLNTKPGLPEGCDFAGGREVVAAAASSSG